MIEENSYAFSGQLIESPSELLGHPPALALAAHCASCAPKNFTSHFLHRLSSTGPYGDASSTVKW